MTRLDRAFANAPTLRTGLIQAEGRAASTDSGDAFLQMITNIEDDPKSASRDTSDPSDIPDRRPLASERANFPLSSNFLPYAEALSCPGTQLSPDALQGAGSAGIAEQEPVAPSTTARTMLVASQSGTPDAKEDLPARLSDGGSEAAKRFPSQEPKAGAQIQLTGADRPKQGDQPAAAVQSTAHVRSRSAGEQEFSAARGEPSSMQELAVGGPKIHVTQLAIHLPLAIDHAVTEMISAPTADNARMGRHAAAPESLRRETLKILSFDVEPAAMGPICVRMKITQSRIEIRMDAQAGAAPALLEAREALSNAIGDKGLSLDAYEVRVAPSPSPPVAAPDAPAEGGSRFERGFANDGRPNQQEKQHAGKRAAPPREDPPPFVPVGLVL